MSLLSLLYPKRCKRCGASLREHQHILCDQCLEDGEYYFYQSFSVPGVDEADAHGTRLLGRVSGRLETRLHHVCAGFLFPLDAARL